MSGLRTWAATSNNPAYSAICGNFSAMAPALTCKTRHAPSREEHPERWPSGLRRTLGKRVCGKPYRGFESHSLRHYTVLLHIRSFESTAKTTSSAIKAVAASAAMLPLDTAQTVAFDRGFGGRISARGNTWPASSNRSTSHAKRGPVNTLTATVSTSSSRAPRRRTGATGTGRTASSAGSALAHSKTCRSRMHA